MNNQAKDSQGEEKMGRPFWGPDQWVKCCPRFGATDSGQNIDEEMATKMASCFNYCGYFLLFPVIFEILFLCLGYFLNPEVIRVLWLTGAGIGLVMCLIGAFFMRRFATYGSFPECCGTWFGKKKKGGTSNASLP